MQPWPEPTSFVACRDCGLLLPLPATTPLPELVAERLDACRVFTASHQAHGLVGLQRRGTETLADRAIWDPMATLRFEVTDGASCFIVTASRPSIDEARTYRFTPGCLPAPAHEVSIDTADVRRGLDIEFHPHAVRPTKLERLSSTLAEAVRHLQPQELEIRHDVPDDPAASMARMPDRVFESILAACGEIFDASELPLVRRFLFDNRDDDGLLMIRVRRHENGASADSGRRP